MGHQPQSQSSTKIVSKLFKWNHLSQLTQIMSITSRKPNDPARSGPLRWHNFHPDASAVSVRDGLDSPLSDPEEDPWSVTEPSGVCTVGWLWFSGLACFNGLTITVLSSLYVDGVTQYFTRSGADRIICLFRRKVPHFELHTSGGGYLSTSFCRLFRYIELFRRGSPVWQTDGRTELWQH